MQEPYLFSSDTVWRNAAGQLHRDDGPAIISAAGSKHWWVNGKRHRIDGPAIEYYIGEKVYYIDDVKYLTEKLWREALLQQNYFVSPKTKNGKLCYECLLTLN